jgi:FdhD protein
VNKGLVEVTAVAIENGVCSEQEVRRQVVREDALTIDVEDIGTYTLMWTPTTATGVDCGYTSEDGLLGELEQAESLALTLGFIVTEGMIASREGIKSISVCADDTDLVRVQLQAPEQAVVARKNIVVNSSCSVCGRRDILESNALGLQTVGDTLRIASGEFAKLMEQMQAGQTVHQQTGGCHGAALFDRSGKLVAIAEDLGRHNALDKVIGLALLGNSDVSGAGLVLSSRLSLEMVVKAIRAGVEIMIAVSAPTSLAIEVADKFGITLCGFVRDGGATVYTHAHRVQS